MSEPDTYLSLWRGEVPKPTDRTPVLRELRREVEAEWGLEPNELFSTRRTDRVVQPRQDFMWRARLVKWPCGRHRYSLPQIGFFLGGMHHTTVLHGVRKHAERTGQPIP